MLKSNIRDAQDVIDKHIEDRLDRAGHVGTSSSKAITPVRTGYLRSRTSHSVSRTATGWRLRIGNSADYALYVHEGTRYMAPQPFLTPIVRDPAFKSALMGE